MEFRRRIKKRRSLLLIPGILLLFIMVSSLILGGGLRPALLAIAEANVSASVSRIMNDAVFSSMNTEEKYVQWVDVHEGENRVYLLQTNTKDLNLLASRTVEKIHARLATLGDQGISVPMGTVSGVSFFAGKGPPIQVSFRPVGSVTSSFRSDFTSAGINQTLHRVFLHLTAEVEIVLPGVTKTAIIEAEVPIAENVIVGEVPSAYTNVASEEDMLNLIPTEAD